MSRSVVALTLGLVSVMAPPPVWAQEQQPGRDDPPVPAAQQPTAANPAASSVSETVAKDAAAAARLNGTRWNIELAPLYGEKPKRPLKDVLQFEQGRITSQMGSSDGYPTSNFTLTIGDDGIPVWETMQTAEQQGVAFWRGELHDETMRGILSKHPLEGAPKDYSFVGQQVSAATAVHEPSQVVEAQPQAQPGSTPPRPEEREPKKARKKRWFW